MNGTSMHLMNGSPDLWVNGNGFVVFGIIRVNSEHPKWEPKSVRSEEGGLRG